MQGTLDLSALEKVVTLMQSIDLESWAQARAIADVVVQAEHKMLTTAEVGKLCGVSEQQVTMWRECGILKGVRTGKPWVFSQEEIRAFQRRFAGYDISNRAKVKIALEQEQKKA